MRSQGQVRFIKVSSRLQMGAAAVVLTAGLLWLGALGTMAVTQYQTSSEMASLLDREATVARSEDRLDAYRGDLDATMADLAKRQDVLDQLADELPEDLLTDSADDTVSDSSKEATRLISLVGESFPEAVGLARLEARQLAFVERMTRFADRRSRRAEEALRSLGLDPASILAQDRVATGGPLELLSTESDGSLDPRFERLGLSIARMSALERGLDGVPQVMPADAGSISSGFGVRHDPFNGHAAMHSGLDFRAPYGSPIHAAAEGEVTFVGFKGGYGRTVEVSHGSGMITRYAHMSRSSAKVGQKVEAGAVIGAIGSSGRSTGPHLHFEVRINGRAVNPRPFLETAPHVLEEARSSSPSRIAGEPGGATAGG
ncbi:M23 family peptidase [Aurantiacibacter xanthus]|uniref:M23 family peptidase n=1 Tax=Aurantiacibacter xanthus TaxID=1784712 RepID=A0A3A1PEV2_9SPHN|nr:M23 family metallopeptidase [Aurantiacibacter xanthus]RIV92362.1 M23 family peptidase [Aurantiacibacter xanthus]